jgi:hypothetical protein
LDHLTFEEKFEGIEKLSQKINNLTKRIE